MKKRKNIYATTNWEEATFSLRVKSLITMFCSSYFLDSIFCSLWVYIFIIRRVYIKFENGAKLEDYNMADKIFFGIFLVTLGTSVFAFVLYVIRGFKLLFGKAMYCNARITFVEKNVDGVLLLDMQINIPLPFNMVQMVLSNPKQ